ncbi:3-hydroxyisobutyrate dehydrogenase [Paraferrimonas sedimenticola]|uniref:3-hydroxyisobutyrate dehydrogenase n=1 Tax=Paraferrimonas sedimenticola TaxID=375674 RepID=A0AA37RRA2_9GAMM|nr:3-hydroxyisobutyrate dehydrogenase [Paraferrimonas sedimenticola]GLP94725.1 3-hydroxyisobutyrate dehydrogenase [Paraferrimonas sedimenticola]
MQRIAFIGLGNMGGPMAANLLKAGKQVKVFDLVQAAIDPLVAAGATQAASALDAVADVDCVVSMLPAGKHVRGLFMGEEGIIAKVNSGTLLIDCSTIDADSARAVAAEAQSKGIDFVDAPVSGGTAGAQAGTLTFICGGSETAVERARDVLDIMGANVFRAGDSGAGQVAKICNNQLLAVLMVGTSEALQLGIDNGLDPKVLSDIMKVSSGGNWTLEKYNPCPGVMEQTPASHGYQGGFMTDLMVKDLGLASEAALSSQSSAPMGALARSLYQAHARAGNGKADFSSIFNYFSRKD